MVKGQEFKQMEINMLVSEKTIKNMDKEQIFYQMEISMLVNLKMI